MELQWALDALEPEKTYAGMSEAEVAERYAQTNGEDA